MLRGLAIQPPSRAFLQFDNYPINYKSQLSEDKRRVTIDLPNAQSADTARNRQGSEDISEIYVQSEGRNLKVFISLKEAKGYTAVPLPYSRSVFVEVFNWERLTPAEDSYRTALLALEDDIIAAAKPELIEAARGGVSEATLFLGLLLLAEGKINSALKNLEYAELMQVNLPDLYAALSQIYFIKKDDTKRAAYAEKFMNLTGAKSISFISIPLIIEQDTLITEDISHLIIKQEASFSNAQLDTAINDRFSNLFVDDSLKEANKDIIPGIYNEVLTLIGGAALVVILLIVLLYLRWRNKQILLNKDLNSMPKSKEKATKKTKQKPTEKTASEAESAPTSKEGIEAKKLLANRAYKKPEPQEKTSKETSSLATKSKNDATKSQSESSKTLEDNKKAIESLLQTIRTSKDVVPEEVQATQQPVKKEEKPKNVSAKIEIAMHLAEEQRRIKQKSIESLDNALSFEQNKLTEVAKKLGIEKGSLETKKAISSIENDSKALEKLKDKFKLS